ncbi:phage tail protein [uncultured Psychroserpens sp.]|uniref:phage tail protein n=1 Tax=uncultured Psychroserpens sp. TaxID=255436 RepID=UPI002606030D|nr:phage tail protein [uncultured Psychroserpens sp.]
MNPSQPSRSPITLPRIRIDFSDLDFYGEEVSGLKFEDSHLEYRNGADNEFHKKRLLGLTPYLYIYIKGGTFKYTFSETEKEIIDKILKEENKATLKIQVDDPELKSCLEWTIPKTFPKKVKGLKFKEDTGLITIEELIFEHKGMSVNECHQKP